MAEGGQEHQDLVHHIKEMQRGDPSAREQWTAYTDSFGGGRKDPAKHPVHFLQDFLAQWETGSKVLQGGVIGGEDLDEAQIISFAVRVLQRRSPGVKELWRHYCETFGGGTYDPTKHDVNFVVEFFDHLGNAALKSVGSGPAGGPAGGRKGGRERAEGKGGRERAESAPAPQKRAASAIIGGGGGPIGGGGGGLWATEPPAKRARGDGIGAPRVVAVATRPPARGLAPSSTVGGKGAAAGGKSGAGGKGKRSRGGGGGGGAGASDPGSREYLVAQVKAFQRMGDDNNQLWGMFVDGGFDGIRDPSRHEASTLQEFVDTHGVPPLDEGASGGGSGGGSGGAYLGGGHDPAKDELVQRVKTFQKVSKDNSEMWREFNAESGTFDPNRHEAETLQEFVSKYAVP